MFAFAFIALQSGEPMASGHAEIQVILQKWMLGQGKNTCDLHSLHQAGRMGQ